MFTKSPSSLSSLSKAKRDLALGLKRSPLFSWRYDTHEVNQLLLVPRDLRTADPSLSIELDMGQFGLAGATVLLNGRSPFHVEPPNESWERELHGFGWLRNLRAARSERAFDQAIDLFDDWQATFRSQKGTAYLPEVAARRLISWFSYSNFLLHEADEARYIKFMRSIEDHMRYLSMSGSHAADGMPRLLSLISLAYAGLCVAEQEQFAHSQVRLMCAELDRQVLADGGHISRDNSVLASILLDLLPLRQCFVTLNQTPPTPLVAAINRMLPMIHYMRLGDGMMSRFNGAGTTLPDTLSTAMAYDDASNKALREARHSKYYRLQRGNVVLLMDGGKPPALDLSQKAHAGCLSFEMSSGTCPLIVNCGAAPPVYQHLAPNARATVSHSTLTVNNRSSANFIHDKKPKKHKMASLLDGPPNVEAHYDHDAESFQIVGSHDGYLEQFGLVHHRLIALSKDGYTVTGEDWIEVPQHTKQVVEGGLGWPFAVHFHIHPDVMTTRASDGKSLTLTLPDTQVWKFSADGGLIYLEESTFYADFAGPCQAVQAVIRGTCLGPTSIPWKFTKVLTETSQPVRKLPPWLVETVLEEELDEAQTRELEREVANSEVGEPETAEIEDAEWEDLPPSTDEAPVTAEKAPEKAAPRKAPRPPTPPPAVKIQPAERDLKEVHRQEAGKETDKSGDLKADFLKDREADLSQNITPPLPPLPPKGKPVDEATPISDKSSDKRIEKRTEPPAAKSKSDKKQPERKEKTASSRKASAKIEPPLKRPKAMPIDEATKILKPAARPTADELPSDKEGSREAGKAKPNKSEANTTDHKAQRDAANAAALSLKAKRISLMEKLEKAARETAAIAKSEAVEKAETKAERPESKASADGQNAQPSSITTDASAAKTPENKAQQEKLSEREDAPAKTSIPPKVKPEAPKNEALTPDKAKTEKPEKITVKEEVELPAKNRVPPPPPASSRPPAPPPVPPASQKGKADNKEAKAIAGDKKTDDEKKKD